MIRLRELREARGMQQKELAIDLCVSQPTVSDWESGRKMPSARSTQRLADYFGVSIDYLLGRDGTKQVSTPIIESKPQYPPEYDLLSPEDKALVDNMIRSLSKKQRPSSAMLQIAPKDKADSETAQSDEVIDREVEAYRRRLILEKNQEGGSSPSNGAGDETA